MRNAERKPENLDEAVASTIPELARKLNILADAVEKGGGVNAETKRAAGTVFYQVSMPAGEARKSIVNEARLKTDLVTVRNMLGEMAEGRAAPDAPSRLRRLATMLEANAGSSAPSGWRRFFGRK